MAQINPVESTDDTKPYVGPRTFKPSEWKRFFGRDREARDLQARIISERFTLFYAQSGAGKSSLINTKIVPGLEAEGFEVLPVARVSGHNGAEVAADNIFTYNLLASLHQREDIPPGLASMTIAHFLDNLIYQDGVFFYDDAYEWPADAQLKPRVLIIDQFEEVITTNSVFWAKREGFFRQLGEALEADEMLWIVLALREDFIASLDPYLQHVNRGVRQRFYMQHLDREAALLAIKRPVEELRPFEDDAAEVLVNNLLAPRQHGERPAESTPTSAGAGGDSSSGPPIGADGHEDARLAEFVEPVQLQAVCYQMWEKLQTRPGPTITCQDVEDFADVDTALVSFYEDTIAQTVENTGVSEIDLRHWFDSELITEAGTRNMVFRGEEDTGGLPTAVADDVRSRFIVREVVRPGGVWYELVHDRFIQPIQESNRNWLKDQPLLQLAEQWADSDRSETRLLTAGQLAEYEPTKWEVLGPLVADFMQFSRAEQKNRERRKTLYQYAAVAATMFFLLGLAVFLIFTVRQLSASNDEKDANATRAAESGAEIARQNTILSTREAQLATSVAERETTNVDLEAALREVDALRLVDAASDYLTQGRLDAAILLGHKAYVENPADPSPRVRSVLFDAMNRKIEQRHLDTPLRGEYPAPVDEAGTTLVPRNLMFGPVVDSMASIESGEIVWWPLGNSDQPSVAQPFATPLEENLNIIDAAFSPERNLLVTSTGAEMRLWWLENGEAIQSQVMPTAGEVSSVTFSADGKRLAVAQNCISSGCAENLIAVWDVAQGLSNSEPLSPITTIASGIPVVDLEFTDEQGQGLAWTDSYMLTIEDIENGGRKVLSRLSDQKMIVTSLAVSPADNLLVVSGCDDVGAPTSTSTPMPQPASTPSGASQTGAQSTTIQPVYCDAADTAWLELWFLDPVNPFGFRLPGRLLEPTFLPDRDQFLFVRGDSATTVSIPFWFASVGAWQSNACAVAGRNLTADEWLDLNPDLSLEQYQSDCDAYPIHPSVVEGLLQQCQEQPTGEAANSCWSDLGEIVKTQLAPESIRLVNDKIADARNSFSRQQRTSSLRDLAEAERLSQEMTPAIAALMEKNILSVYADICTDDTETDSPAALEACSHAVDLNLEANRSETVGESGQKLWRFEGQAGEIVTVAVEALEGGDATLTLFNERLAQVAYNDDFSGYNPQFTQQLAEDGTYIIVVNWLGTPGSYILTTSKETPRSLTVDEPVTADGAEQHLWRINGRAGEFISILMETNTEAGASLKLSDDLFNQIAFNDSANGLPPRIDTFLPYDGTYLVEVGWSGTPGLYTLSAERAEPDSLKLGDTIEDADPQQRLWYFQGVAGDYVTIALEAVEADATLKITGPDGSEVAYNDDFDGQFNPRVDAVLTSDGMYTIEVGWLTAPAPYTLATTRSTPELIALGTTLQAGPEQHLFQFEGKAGDSVTISARAQNIGDAWLRLRDEQYAELAFNDNFGELFDPQVSYLLPYDGVYYIELGWFGAADEAELEVVSAPPKRLELGDVQQADTGQRVWRIDGAGGELVAITVGDAAGQDIMLWLRDAENAPLAYDDSLDGGPFPQIVYMLPAGAPVFVEVSQGDGTPAAYSLSATVIEPEPLALGEFVPEVEPDQRLWVFDGHSGDSVVLAVQALEGNDPLLTLRNEQFEVLATNDSFGGQPDPQIAYQLPEDGTYFLEVSWNGAPGLYALSADTVDPASLPIDVSVTEPGSAAAPLIFEGEAGDLVKIDLEIPDDGYAWLNLYDRHFELLTDGLSFAGQPHQEISFVLPEDGPYTIEVGWNGTPGRYTLNVSRVPPITLPIDESVPGGGAGRSAWAFEGRAGEIVSAAVRSLNGGDMYLGLFDAQHNQLAYSDDFSDTDPQLTMQLPADGLYTLEVGWQDWTGVFAEGTLSAPMFGPYRLVATSLEPRPLAIGETMLEATADQRLWRFEGRAGDVVTLAAESTAGGDNLWLRLFDDQFVPVAFNDNADGLNPQLTVELPEMGEYFIEVGWFGESGAYRLATGLE